MAAVTNKQLLEIIEELKKKMPNGNLLLIQQAIDDLQKGQDDLRDDIRFIKEKLLNPDKGIIVKVNKNTEDRLYWEKRKPEIENAFDTAGRLLRWQGGVNKALWITFASIVGLLIKIVFFGT